MPDEGRSVWGDDVETRVRIPPARAASSTSLPIGQPWGSAIAARRGSSSFRKIR